MNLLLTITGRSHAPRCAAAEIQAMLNDLVTQLDDIANLDDDAIQFPVRLRLEADFGSLACQVTAGQPVKELVKH
jgi:hypothetical protein